MNKLTLWIGLIATTVVSLLIAGWKLLSLGADSDDLKEADAALKSGRERKKLDEDLDRSSSDDITKRLRDNDWLS